MSTDSTNLAAAVTPPPGAEVPLLAYGRSRRSNKWAVRSAVAVLAGMAAFLATRWALPKVSFRLAVQRQQSALLTMTRPPQLPVWEDDEATAAALLANGWQGYEYVRRSVPGAGTVRSTTAAILADDPRAEFNASAALLPGEFIVFSHARSAGGKVKLVLVTGAVASWETRPGPGSQPPVGVPDWGRMVYLASSVVEAGTPTRKPSLRAGPSRLMSLQLHPFDRFRLHAGQVDPSDPSGFAIEYVCNGVRGSLDGTLNADDTVTLTPRAGDGAPVRVTGDILLPAGTKRPH